jgi:hypothetical protein
VKFLLSPIKLGVVGYEKLLFRERYVNVSSISKTCEVSRLH